MFGLPVQGIDLPHLERRRKGPKTTPVKAHVPKISTQKTGEYAPKDKIRIVLEGF